MALPTTIHTGVELQLNGCGRMGPFQNGAFYNLVAEISGGSLTGAISMMKTTDPVNGSWSEQDVADRPTLALPFSSSFSMSAIPDGNTIKIVTQYIDTVPMTPTGPVHYHVFDTSTDQWTLTEEAIATPASVGLGTLGVDICIANSVPVVVYMGPQASVMGTPYFRLSIAHRTGGSWTAGIALDGGGEVHYGGPSCVGFGTRAHFHFIRDSARPQHRSWTNAAGFDTVRDIGGASDGAGYVGGLSTVYDSSGTGKVLVPYHDLTNSRINVALYDSGADPTITIQQVSTAMMFASAGQKPPAVCGHYNGVNHLLFIRASDVDLYHSENSGSGWSTPTAVEASITSNRLSGTLYQRDGSTVFAYAIQKDNVEYNEYLIDAGSPSGGSDATVEVDATGAGTKKTSGGDDATVSVNPSGGGKKSASGGSSATVNVDATAGGRKNFAEGSSTSVEVSSTGAGTKQGKGGDDATVNVDATGAGGNKTTSGGSDATVQVSATGAGATARAGGSDATVQVSANGSGFKSARSGEDATVQVSANGSGSKTTAGGEDATVQVSATGGGFKSAFSGSSAEVEVNPTGGGTAPGSGSGGSSTEVEVDATAGGFKNAIGGSAATVSVDASGAGSKSVTSGSDTTVEVSATGSGSKQARAGASAAVEVSTSGGGSKHTFSGSIATVNVDATGGGTAPGQGGSQAEVEVSATSGGSKQAFGGSSATVSSDATGAGLKGAFSGSTATVQVSSTGGGAPGVPPIVGGSTATVQVSSTGSGVKHAAGGSSALIEVGSFGQGTKSASGASLALVAVLALGEGQKLAMGGSFSTVEVGATGGGEPVDLSFPPVIGPLTVRSSDPVTVNVLSLPVTVSVLAPSPVTVKRIVED